MLHDLMFQLDVPVEGVLRAVEAVAISLGTAKFLQDVLVAASLQLLGTFDLPPLEAADRLEHF